MARSYIAVLLLLVAAAAVVAAAEARNVTCPQQPLAPGRYEFSFEYEGLERRFLVYVPTTYTNNATALFLNFHGYLTTMEFQYDLTGMETVAEEGNFVAVVPQGWRLSWSAGACCGSAARQEIDDVGFTRALVDYMRERVCVDPDRIFAAGYSNGGYFSYRLACEASDLIRAIGQFAGALSSESYFPCSNQTKTIPVYSLHGTSDHVVPYERGEESIQRYTREVLQCTDNPVETFRNNSATCITWSACSGGSEAHWCSIQRGVHEWPGIGKDCGCFTGDDWGCRRATQDINATRQIWAFFDRISRARR